MPKHKAQHRHPRSPKREPVAIAAGVTIVISLAALFGLHLDRQTAGAVVTVVLAVAGWWVRNRVTPVAAPQLPVEAVPDLRVTGLEAGQARALLRRKGIDGGTH